MTDKVTLFLMTEKGYSVLKVLAREERYLKFIDTVVVAKDSNVQKDFYKEIKSLCREKELRFVDRNELEEVRSTYAIAVSWRWMIEAKTTKLIVFHDSLLPKYRGFAPLVSSLINGDDEIGVTALLATKEYDRGDILAQSKIQISYPIKVQNAIFRLTKCYEELANRVMALIIEGDQSLVGVAQVEADATYSLWRDDEDYKIDWNQSAQRIKRFIDAVGWPYKGAFTSIDGRRARILDSEIYRDLYIENRDTGKVIFVEEKCPVVVCGEGLLKVTNIVEDQTGEPLLPLDRFRVRFC